MKKALLAITFFFACLASLQSQILYGTTSKGGNDGGGAIHKFSPDTKTLTVAQSFESPAAGPSSGFLQANDGKLYGMTTYGGSNDVGVIFSYDAESATYIKLWNFVYADGGYPLGALIQANDGQLYGMTSAGGSKGVGVIFSYDPTTGRYNNVIDFTEDNGAKPRGDLMQASDGKLYGMTYFGGSTDEGVIFSYDPLSSTYTKLKDFDYYSAYPAGNLIQASDGKLYGLTSSLGDNDNYGIIFSYDPLSSTYTKLKDFDYTNGGYPFGSLVEANDGKLYGTTSQGGSSNAGVIFSFNIASAMYKKLKDFDYTNGGNPFGSLIQANDGKLYGLTFDGGINTGGVIFSFQPSALIYKKLKSFQSTIGSHPTGSLFQANDGTFYGMTTYGGKIDRGVIFSYDAASASYLKLEDFGTNKTGNNLSSGLTRGANGLLYGVTSYGGSNGFGVIFSFDPVSFVYKKLKDFDGATGGNPFGSLVQANDGKLYGMTYLGGLVGWGVIFSFDPPTATYKKLKDFDYFDGTSPLGRLVQANDGKLYGMTTRGGNDDAGVIFSFDPVTFIYEKRKDFDQQNEEFGSGSLIQAGNGKLYGMTSADGSDNSGGIFSFDPSSSTFKMLKKFSGNDGSRPLGSSLMQASNGKLYGTTFNGGSADAGVIFSFDPASRVYTKLKNFSNNSTGGSNPTGSLMQASDGKLYGVTRNGGNSDFGVIFSYDPAASIYKELKDYDGANGAYPGSGFAFVEIKEFSPLVTLLTPAGNATYLAGGNVYLNAAASDSDGTISKIEFYSGTTLLHITTDTPYTFKWQKVNQGNYILTAKATDNCGLVTTSAPVHISVVPNTPPTISIVSPANDQTFVSPANFHLQAVAEDVDGRVTTVEFYNGTTLLVLERKVPYTYN